MDRRGQPDRLGEATHIRATSSPGLICSRRHLAKVKVTLLGCGVRRHLQRRNLQPSHVFAGERQPSLLAPGQLRSADQSGAAHSRASSQLLAWSVRAWTSAGSAPGCCCSSADVVSAAPSGTCGAEGAACILQQFSIMHLEVEFTLSVNLWRRCRYCAEAGTASSRVAQPALC